MKTDCSWDHSLARWERQQTRPSAGLLLAEHQYCTLAHWQVLMCTEGPLTACDLEEHSHQEEVEQDRFEAGRNLSFNRELQELWSQGVQPSTPLTHSQPRERPLWNTWRWGAATTQQLSLHLFTCTCILCRKGRAGRLAQKQWASTDEQDIRITFLG